MTLRARARRACAIRRLPLRVTRSASSRGCVTNPRDYPGASSSDLHHHAATSRFVTLHTVPTRSGWRLDSNTFSSLVLVGHARVLGPGRLRVRSRDPPASQTAPIFCTQRQASCHSISWVTPNALHSSFPTCLLPSIIPLHQLSSLHFLDTQAALRLFFERYWSHRVCPCSASRSRNGYWHRRCLFFFFFLERECLLGTNATKGDLLTLACFVFMGV